MSFNFSKAYMRFPDSNRLSNVRLESRGFDAELAVVGAGILEETLIV